MLTASSLPVPSFVIQTEGGLLYSRPSSPSSFSYSSSYLCSRSSQLSSPSPLHLSVFLQVKGPKLNPEFELGPQQCPAQGTVTVLVLLAMLWLVQTMCHWPLAHLGMSSSFSATVNQTAPLFCLATLQLPCPQPVEGPNLALWNLILLAWAH